MMSEPTCRPVDAFLQEPHQPHQYARYAAYRLHEDGAAGEALAALEAIANLPRVVQEQVSRGVRLLRRANEEGNPDLARPARWREGAPSLVCVYDMGASDSGGRAWLHHAWDEMVGEFVEALSNRERVGREA